MKNNNVLKQNIARNEKKLHELDPEFAKKVKLVLIELENKGWQPVIAEARRTLAQQREKVRKGFSKTMQSKHLTGHAADIIDKRWGWHGPAADLDHEFWQDLGVAAAQQNLVWGGNWQSFKDVAHVQAS